MVQALVLLLGRKTWVFFFVQILNFITILRQFAVVRLRWLVNSFVIRTSTEFKLSSSLKALYCSLVLPLFEYSSILRDPFTAAESYDIERAHWHFCSSASFILQIPIHHMIIGE